MDGGSPALAWLGVCIATSLGIGCGSSTRHPPPTDLTALGGSSGQTATGGTSGTGAGGNGAIGGTLGGGAGTGTGGALPMGGSAGVGGGSGGTTGGAGTGEGGAQVTLPPWYDRCQGATRIAVDALPACGLGDEVVLDDLAVTRNAIALDSVSKTLRSRRFVSPPSPRRLPRTRTTST